MTDVESIDREELFSIARLAKAFQMGRDTVSKRLQQAGVRAADSRGGHAVYLLRDAVPALFQFGVDDDGAVDVSRLMPSDQLALARADESRTDNAIKQRKLQQLEGSLVERGAARLEMAEMVKGVIQLLDILPDILERDCDLPPKAVVRMQEVIDRERGQLAERLES